MLFNVENSFRNSDFCYTYEWEFNLQEIGDPRKVSSHLSVYSNDHNIAAINLLLKLVYEL